MGRVVARVEAKLQQIVDQVCEQGCARVRDCINALQQAETFPEYASLDKAQRELLLRELQAIMSIYDDRC